MITLRDILKLNPFITLLSLDVRKPNGRLIKYVVIGKDYRVTAHQKWDEGKGEFEYIDNDINHYGRVKKNGMSETTYDIDWKSIPKKYLDMEVDLIHSIYDQYGGKGMQLRATVIPIQMELDPDCGWR